MWQGRERVNVTCGKTRVNMTCGKARVNVRCGKARVNVTCAAGSAGIICQTDCRHVSVLASEFHDVGAGVRISGEQYSRFVLLGSKSQVSSTHVLF